MKLEKETLAKMRRQDTGPTFKKRGGRVVYHREDLNAWRKADSRRCTATAPRRHRTPALVMLAGVMLVVVASCLPKYPLFMWNASASVPVGLYRLSPGVPALGDLALVRLTGRAAIFAHRQGVLPPSVYLLKPVAAVAGDRVCRFGPRILVRGRFMARVLARDRLGHRMPVWSGCHRLKPGELFVLADHQQSFDSRYFGRVSVRAIVGRVVLLWSAHR